MKNMTSVMMIMSSPILVFSSPNWLTTWMFLEIGTMGFIQLMKSKSNSESSILYFMIQVIASSMILANFMIKKSNLPLQSTNLSMTSTLISLAIMMKIGASPLHHWYMKTGKSMKAIVLITLMTIQKMAPLMLIQTLSNKVVTSASAILSAITGVIAQATSSKTKLLIIFSSINHTGWLMILASINSVFMLAYMVIYGMINASILKKMEEENFTTLSTQESNKAKKDMVILFLSLAGIPPLLGFIPKWFTLSLVFKEKSSLALILLILLLSVANAYIYSRFLIFPGATSPMTSKIMINTTNQPKKTLINQMAPTPALLLLLKQ